MKSQSDLSKEVSRRPGRELNRVHSIRVVLQAMPLPFLPRFFENKTKFLICCYLAPLPQWSGPVFRFKSSQTIGLVESPNYVDSVAKKGKDVVFAKTPIRMIKIQPAPSWSRRFVLAG